MKDLEENIWNDYRLGNLQRQIENNAT